MRSRGKDVSWHGLLHDQLGLQCAGRFDALENGDDAVRPDAKAVKAGDQRFEVRSVLRMAESPSRCEPPTDGRNVSPWLLWKNPIRSHSSFPVSTTPWRFGSKSLRPCFETIIMSIYGLLFCFIFLLHDHELHAKVTFTGFSVQVEKSTRLSSFTKHVLLLHPIQFSQPIQTLTEDRTAKSRCLANTLHKQGSPLT